MNRILYRLISLTIGFGLIALAIIWGQDLDACPGLLFAGGVAVLFGSKPIREQQS